MLPQGVLRVVLLNIKQHATAGNVTCGPVKQNKKHMLTQGVLRVVLLNTKQHAVAVFSFYFRERWQSLVF